MLDIARKLKGKNQMRVLGGRNVASLIAAVTCLATASGLAGCAEQSAPQFVVGVPEQSLGNSPMPNRNADAFARYLVRGLKDDHRKVERKLVSADYRVRQLRTGEVTVTFGCTGELLQRLDRNRGLELRREYADREAVKGGEQDESAPKSDAPKSDTSKSDREWEALVYDELRNVLPQDIGITAPGEAMPCQGTVLPQNAVVLYAKEGLSRDIVGKLNSVATGTTMEMLGG